MHDHGIQMEAKSYFNYSLRKQFLAPQDFEHIVITEGLIQNQVIYYMAFLIQGQEKMVLPFMVHKTKYFTFFLALAAAIQTVAVHFSRLACGNVW